MHLTPMGSHAIVAAFFIRQIKTPQHNNHTINHLIPQTKQSHKKTAKKLAQTK